MIIEHFASRNFNVGSRVRAYYNNKWYHGIVLEKYYKENKDDPYVMVKTDTKVEDNPKALEEIEIMERIIDSVMKKYYPKEARERKKRKQEKPFLDGFGLECSVASPRILFENEREGGDEIYTKTYLRDLTSEEKERAKRFEDEIPF